MSLEKRIVMTTLAFLAAGTAGCAVESNEDIDAEDVKAEEQELEEQLEEQEFEGLGGASADDIATTEQAIFGSSACKDPDILIENTADYQTVKVRALEYWDQTSEKWRSEDIRNEILYGAEEIYGQHNTEWYHDTLENTRNHRIGTWKIKYQTWNGSSWSGYKWTGKVKPYDGYGRKCVTKAGTNYHIKYGNW